MNDESVKSSGLDDPGRWCTLEVLLLVLTGLWVLVLEDEVDLVRGTALVGPEHDDIGRCVREFLSV